jgi:energy-coupling factor transport system permease protein
MADVGSNNDKCGLQTVERDSFFTRLDFRPKLALMVAVTAVAFLWESPLMQVALCTAVALGCITAGVKLGYLRKLLVVMIPFYAFLLLTMGFFNVDHVRGLLGGRELTPLVVLPEGWPVVGGGRMTLEGLLFGLNIVFKTLTMVLVIPLAIFTTDANQMIVGLVRARVPYKLAFVFSSTLRFFPLLFEESQAIIAAQRLRGLAVEQMGPIRRLRVYARLAVPLILSAVVRSQQVEVVLQAKAFTGSPERTYLHESVLGARDRLIIAASGLLLVAAFVAYFSLGLGRFGGPLDFI